MLECDVTGADSPSHDVVDHNTASTVSDCALSGVTSPPLSTFLADPAPAVRPSADEEDLPRCWDWSATAHNNNCTRYPPTKPEVEMDSSESGSRRTDVGAMALSRVQDVLRGIDSIAERQQIVGDLIVQLQVLRCRLQLAQVNHHHHHYHHQSFITTR